MVDVLAPDKRKNLMYGFPDKEKPSPLAVVERCASTTKIQIVKNWQFLVASFYGVLDAQWVLFAL